MSRDFNVKSCDCAECGIKFKTGEEQNTHNKKHHTSDGSVMSKFVCNKCDNVFQKKYLLVQHRLSVHNEEKVILITEKSEVIDICDFCEKSFNNFEEKATHCRNEHCNTEGIAVETVEVSSEYNIRECPEKTEKVASVWSVEESHSYQNMTMKGGSEAYKEACTALKSELVKGKLFKDSHGRQLNILEVPKDKKPIIVEVTTKSNKPNEKRGKAKIHMWEPSKKKPCTIMVSRHLGSEYVFVKTVMEKFIKPFIDAIISEPDEDPLDIYRVKTQDNPLGKEKGNVKIESDTECDKCGQMFKGKHGLGIHMGKMHGGNSETEEKKRKYTDENNFTPSEKEKIICDLCGGSCTTVEGLKNHMIQCKANINVCDQTEHLKQSNKFAKGEDIKEVSKTCSECDIKICANNGKELILKTIQHNYVCTMKPVVNNAPKLCEIMPSPPRKKKKDTESKEVEGKI